MSEVGYFFDAVQDATTGDWDKTYTSADFAQLFNAIFTNGVVPAYAGCLAVSTGSTGTLPTINVATGSAVINGRVYVNTSTVSKTLTALEGSVNRIDRVVVELNVNARTYAIKVLEGEANSSPVAPSVSQGDIIYQLALADVLVTPGSATISADGLTDLRGNDDVCGWCSVRLRDVDLSTITQNWYDSLREVYDPDEEIEVELEGETVTTTSTALVLSLLSKTAALQEALRLTQEAKEVTNRTLSALLYPGFDTTNGGSFGRQSLVSRDAIVNDQTGAVTGIAANDFDLIAVVLRCSTDIDTDYARVISKTGNAYLTCVGTNPHPYTDNITDAEIKKRTPLKKRTNFYDYRNTITVFLRKGDITEASYFDKYTGLYIRRELRWLTEDHSVICGGGTYKSGSTAQKDAPSVRFGRTASVAQASERAVETFQNAIYFGHARYYTKKDSNTYDGDKQEWTRGTYSVGYSRSDETSLSKNPVNINRDYDQFLIPVAIIGFAYKASTDTAARYHAATT